MFRHYHLIKYLFNRELSEMYISIAIKNLALSMIGIFIPIYLYADLGYSLFKVAMFFLIYSISMMVTSLAVPKLTSRFSLKRGILLSMFLFIINIILLQSLHYHGMFYLPAMVWGVANSIYWISFHTDFVKNSDRRNRSQEVSLWYIMAFLGVLLGPIFGSIIITYLGFLTLFLVSILILLLSAVPLFMSPEMHEIVRFSYGDMFRKSNIKQTFFYIFYGIRVIVGNMAVPLFIFLVLGKYVEVGGIASIAALSSMMISLFVGRVARTEKRERKFFKYGAIFHSLGLFIFVFIKTFIHFVITNIYLSLSFVFVEIPHHSMMYSKAKKTSNPLGYICYREAAISLGRVLGILIIILTGSLLANIVISGIAVMIMAFL